MDNIFFIHLSVIFICFILNIFIYFFMTIFLTKKYFVSIKTSSSISFFFLIVFLLYFVALDFFYFITFIIFINLLYIFFVVMHTPNSSIRFKILNILYDRKSGLKKKNLLKKYNDIIIFNKRIKRLVESGAVHFHGNYYLIKSSKSLFLHNVNTFLKKLIF
jgi:hypothetical protein